MVNLVEKTLSSIFGKFFLNRPRERSPRAAMRRIVGRRIPTDPKAILSKASCWYVYDRSILAICPFVNGRFVTIQDFLCAYRNASIGISPRARAAKGAG